MRDHCPTCGSSQPWMDRSPHAQGGSWDQWPRAGATFVCPNIWHEGTTTCPTCGVPVPFPGMDELKAWWNGYEISYCINGHALPDFATDATAPNVEHKPG